MAITVKQRKSPFSLTGVFGFLITIGVLALAAYYLFFAPTPAFEVIIPGPLERTQTISTFDLDPKTVFNSPEFRSLDSYDKLPTGGTFGRPNPFLGF